MTCVGEDDCTSCCSCEALPGLATVGGLEELGRGGALEVGGTGAE